MLRSTWILGLMMLAWLAPASAGELPRGPADRQRDLLLRYGTCLQAVDRQHQVVRQICDLANPEQLEVLDSLRISPSQFVSLVRVVQENMPPGDLDEKGWTELRRRVTPRFEDILGSDQFDLLLELAPSPQQWERARAILAEAAATPEGRAAWEAASELRASLTPEQERGLAPFLDLAKPEDPAPTPKAGPRPAAAKPAPEGRSAPERRLVFLRQTSLGEFYAEALPRSDHGLYLPKRYRVEGADPAVLAAVSSAEGLPVRLLGTWEDDVVRVVRGTFGLPPVQPVSGEFRVWRGRLPARVVSGSPPTVELDAGRGRRITARLDFQNRGEEKSFAAAAAGGGEFLLGATCLAREGEATLVDLDFGTWQPVEAPFQAGCLLQLSEEFLRHAAEEYRAGHQDSLRFGNTADQFHFRVDDLGVTLRDCQAGQLRLFGAAVLGHSGLDVLEAQFEVLTRAEFVQGRLRIVPVPGSLRLRVTFPLLAEMPGSWIRTLEATLGQEYSDGVTIHLPEPVRESVLSSGLLEPKQLDGLALFTMPGADRRTSLLAVAAPASPEAAATDVLRPRIEGPAEFALALSDEAITAALRRKVPELLPIRREVPADLQMNQDVRLTEIEIPELDLSFAEGQFQINHCVVNVYWTYLLFSGVEPGIRFQGTARVAGSGDPLQLKANLKVKSLEFLSERILSMSPEEQQQIKDKLIKVMEEREFEVSLPSELPATVLSPRARWVLTAVRGSETPSELLLQGGLKP